MKAKLGCENPKAAPRSGGYSLIEIMMALGVTGVMFAACLTGFSRGFSAVQSDRENSRAGQILLEKMELLRLYNWTQVTGADTNTYIPTTFTAKYYPGAGNGGFVYNGTVSITNSGISQTYSNAIKTITVAITWTSGRVTHYRSMSTFVSQYGLQNYIY